MGARSGDGGGRRGAGEICADGSFAGRCGGDRVCGAASGAGQPLDFVWSVFAGDELPGASGCDGGTMRTGDPNTAELGQEQSFLLSDGHESVHSGEGHTGGSVLVQGSTADLCLDR